MAGAKLALLQHHLDRRVMVARGLAHRLGAMPDDHDRPLGLQRRAGLHGMDQQRRPGDPVQHLGQVGIHPRALTGGEDDEGTGHD
jgi:hypothetical protein